MSLTKSLVSSKTYKIVGTTFGFSRFSVKYTSNLFLNDLCFRSVVHCLLNTLHSTFYLPNQKETKCRWQHAIEYLFSIFFFFFFPEIISNGTRWCFRFEKLLLTLAIHCTLELMIFSEFSVAQRKGKNYVTYTYYIHLACG